MEHKKGPGLAPKPMIGVFGWLIQTICRIEPSQSRCASGSELPNRLPRKGTSLEDAIPRAPLSQVRDGAYIRIKQFNTTEDTAHRLREMGLLEEQPIHMLIYNSTVICRVCNTRLGLSPKLAAQILVEHLLRHDI
jgi:Fe2+ transport system protein FeoA